MAKKKNKSKYSNLRGPILVFIILLGGLMLLLRFQSNNQNINNLISFPTATPTPIFEDKISELVTFNLLSGWKKEKFTNSQDKNYTLRLYSPNLSKSCCGGPNVPAVSIYIKYQPVEKAQTLEEEYKEIEKSMNDTTNSRQELSELKKLTIAGLPGLSYLYDFEGHGHIYRVWSPKYKYEITVATSFPEDETKNLKDINYILDSLKFTE